MTLAAPARARNFSRNFAHTVDFALELLNPDAVRADMDLLARTVAPDLTGDRRARFHGALNRIQAETYPFATSDGSPLYIFRDSSGVSRKMVAELLSQPELPRDWEYSDFEVARLIRDTNRAFDFLASAVPELAGAVRELVGAILFAQNRRSAGGSSPAHAGVVLFSRRPDWTTEEYACRILHEAVHQRLFLRDMLHGLLAAGGEADGDGDQPETRDPGYWSGTRLE